MISGEFRWTTEKDYYATLGIDKHAYDADIKKAYRHLALKYHPQRNSDADAFVKFCEIAEAYDALSDPNKRAIYDQYGEKSLKGGVPLDNGGWVAGYTYHGNAEKTFKQFFGTDNPLAEPDTADGFETKTGFGEPSGQLDKKQDPPVVRDLYVTLKDLFYGCRKAITISRREMNKDGHTTSIEEKTFFFDIKPGLKDGTRLTFPKEGDQGPNNIPADIVFIVNQKPHPLFHRENNNLLYTADISLEKALTGFTVDVKTLDGKLLSIPVNDIVHPKYCKVVHGEGMPIFLNPSMKGNLILQFNILFPTLVSAERKQLIKSVLSKCCQHPLQQGSQNDTNEKFKGSAKCHDVLSVYAETAASGETRTGSHGQLDKKQDPPITRDLYVTLKDLFYGCRKAVTISRREMNEDGRTTSIKEKTLFFNVKPGLEDGTRLTFPKEGDQGPNNIPADIVFIVRQKPHPLFHRENNDLIYTADISLEKALTCFAVGVETLDGKLLSIPVNDIVHHKYCKVVHGEGMPLLSNPSAKGNLILQFNILFPKKLSPEQKQLMKKALSK